MADIWFAGQMAQRVVMLNWLGGKSVLPPRLIGHGETWDLSMAVKPAHVAHKAQTMWLEQVDILPDVTHNSGMTFWLMARKPG